MSLTQEQKIAIQAANDKLQILKEYCKKNEIDLTQLLSPEQIKEMKSGVAFLKEMMPKVEMAGMGVLVEDETAFSIPKGKFIAAAQAQLRTLQDADAMKTVQEWNAYTVDAAIFNAAFGKAKLNTPFGQFLKEEILARTKGAEDVAAIKKIIMDLVVLSSQSKSLGKHYDQNRDYYKSEAVYEPILVVDIDDLKIAIKNAIEAAITDPSFPANVAKAEKEAAKAEKEAAAEKEFSIAYDNWLSKQKEICAKIISSDGKTDSVFNIPKSSFLAMLTLDSKNWAVAQPELTEDICTTIQQELANKDSVIIGDCVHAMAKALAQIKTPIEIVRNNWVKSKMLPSYFILEAELRTSSSGTSSYDFIGAYMTWAALVGGAADSLKLNPTQQFIKSKILKEFSNLMKEPKIEFFYPVLEKKLNALKKDFPTLKELSAIWQSTLYDVVVNSDSLTKYYNKIQSTNSANLSVIVKNLESDLRIITSVDTIKRIFSSCLRPAPEKKDLANGEPLNLTIYMKDGTILSNTIATSIVEINKKPCVIPSSASISATSGDWGYDFELKEFFTQSPIENGTEGVTTYFQFKLAFSKSKGSDTHGTSNSEEVSREHGQEKSTTDVLMKNVGSSIKGVDGSIEWGTEETTGTFDALGFAHSKSTSDETTVDKGTNTGHFLVMGYLYSYEVSAGGTLKVDVVVDSISSPDSKGFARSQKDSMTVGKTLRWAK